jgi:hypothetical protein
MLDQYNKHQVIYGRASDLRRTGMTRYLAALALVAALTAAFSNQSAQAFGLGYSRGVNLGIERVRVQRMALRGKLALTDKRAAEPIAVNAAVND